MPHSILILSKIRSSGDVIGGFTAEAGLGGLSSPMVHELAAEELRAPVAVSFYSVLPRSVDLQDCGKVIRQAIRWSEAAGLDGMLIYTGAGAVVEPWMAAATVLSESEHLHPIVAVNPFYQHPFTSAQMLLSMSLLHGRRVDLNLITGTAVRHLEALGFEVSHDDRYSLLGEYTEIILHLLDSARPFSFDGRFYHVQHLRLASPLPRSHMPKLFVAGHSAAAHEFAQRYSAVNLQMLAPEGNPGGSAVSFGVVTRPEAPAALAAAHELFPYDPAASDMLKDQVAENDSVWLKELFLAAGQEDDKPIYQLAQFRSMHVDCPYLIGAYETLAAKLVVLARKGVHTFVIDVPTRESEYCHLARVVESVRTQLREPLQ